MNKITERIKELEGNILFNENEIKKCEWSPKGRVFCNTTRKVEIFAQKLEILELNLYLMSVITSIEEELKTLNHYQDGTCYKVEDIKNILKKIKITAIEEE